MKLRRPTVPGPCSQGCGRTARVLVPLLDVHVLRDVAGAEVGRRTSRRLAPYCRPCLPEHLRRAAR